ncbi:hypothetical protein [Mucilaginibacter arboris]|uniref:Uncharacterized protein n=1 Tax=Mucilaginibacter arboris TaxID=2682090 RepID=A0A7K1SUC0_9SPHI|nr:hypothetical protein [Mucilaginibacter arboris]MVN20660.1 hypothetical protein [Mucilaginibacter arboris]
MLLLSTKKPQGPVLFIRAARASADFIVLKEASGLILFLLKMRQQENIGTGVVKLSVS